MRPDIVSGGLLEYSVQQTAYKNKSGYLNKKLWMNPLIYSRFTYDERSVSQVTWYLKPKGSREGFKLMFWQGFAFVLEEKKKKKKSLSRSRPS